MQIEQWMGRNYPELCKKCYFDPPTNIPQDRTFLGQSSQVRITCTIKLCNAKYYMYIRMKLVSNAERSKEVPSQKKSGQAMMEASELEKAKSFKSMST